jgi:DNA-binding transcriptional MerR regulator
MTTNINSIADQAWGFNLTTRNIHTYEDKALLSPECQGQHRGYCPHFIKRDKWLYILLNEIRQVISLYDVNPSEVSHLKLFLSKLLQQKDTAG